jgi:hypothetical protein
MIFLDGFYELKTRLRLRQTAIKLSTTVFSTSGSCSGRRQEKQ